MVARIKYSTNIRKPFHYNDLKVQEGNATLLMAENIFIDINNWPEMAVLLLEKQVALRPDIEKSSIHISLNFSPDEQLTDDLMQEIAKGYMEGIGFGNQPYLVYRHFDSGHPHCHIVSTNICLDKTRIPTHDNFKQSELVRKTLEEKYNLIKAEGRKQTLFQSKEIDASRVIYGKSATKKAIGIVLEDVLTKYKFTSIPELNAILSLYNVRADKGTPDSRLNKSGGLYYRILDKQGMPVGVPIKASLFAGKPTLKELQKKFLKHDVDRQQFKNSIRSRVDVSLKFSTPDSLQSLKDLLKEKDIRLIEHTNDQGLIYGLSYVDLKNKVIFNGSALGKQYSAKPILERIYVADEISNTPVNTSSKISPISVSEEDFPIKIDRAHYDRLDEKSALELLSQYEYANSAVPYEWRKANKKKKKRRAIR